MIKNLYLQSYIPQYILLFPIKHVFIFGLLIILANIVLGHLVVKEGMKHGKKEKTKKQEEGILGVTEGRKARTWSCMDPGV
ncbi:hypothetical protein [Rossellomorea vietnamensis]|uniref:hypothetical protein n=1 Tax=Rossellomorea vietnamensis TaxID=218284 RepID=UPI001E5F6441|nr:hypothetical protein [Rossellomorea vietnamensis]MCC5801783.1 hypothetical protein [Rossellomorea vietnamensis]